MQFAKLQEDELQELNKMEKALARRKDKEVILLAYENSEE